MCGTRPGRGRPGGPRPGARITEDGLSFRSARLPPAFAVHVRTLEPGTSHPYDPDEWRDALVVVEEGELELECDAGGRRRFGRGAVLSFAGLSLRRMHNPGAGPTVLVAVSRTRPGGAPLRADPDRDRDGGPT